MCFKINFVICVVASVTVCVFGANLSREDEVVYYSKYGAAGNGVTDDFEAIFKAHAYANEKGLKVRADTGATYYICVTDKKAIQVQTDTDWGDAKFIIDDSKAGIENHDNHIFQVTSKLSPIEITTVKKLKKNQKKINLPLQYEHDSFLVDVTDNTVRRFIRSGVNQDKGDAGTEAFIIDKNGNVDMSAPVIWDYDNISSMVAYPIDTQTLTVRGGHFTTIANQAEPRSSGYKRNIRIQRSNVLIDGVHHAVKGEGDRGAPYTGFINIRNSANVTVQNCKLSGRRIYFKKTKDNKSVRMGSYGITVRKGINITFKNCEQINDIHDKNRWGIFASNYSKNIIFDAVSFSRFDAHRGVANATIKNSVIGHQGIKLTGTGLFLVENTKVYATNFISLRNDYGSTWDGEIIIRNCEFVTKPKTSKFDAVLINGSNSGKHDFGYTCYMPRKITVDGLVINDSNRARNYRGPKIFAPFNKAYTGKEKYPYIITEEVEFNNLAIKSGKPYFISDNSFMFRNVKITEKRKGSE